MKFWSECTEKLEAKLSQEEFNTWIKPLRADINKNNLEISAPNDFVLTYVKENLGQIIENLVNKSNQSLNVKSVDIDGISYEDIVNPMVINAYPDYKINTPSSITTSAAFVIGKFGILSMDLISRDYSKSKIRPNRDFLNTNSEISTKLTNTFDIRVGTEIRLNEFSFRGGYTKIQSPYKNLEMLGNSNSYSFGFGYDFGSSILSFSHKILKSEKRHQLFDSGLTDLAKISTNHSVSNLSLIFKF